MSKPFTEVTCAQRSPEWYAARCGVFTASRAHDVFATLARGGYRAERKHYRTELVIERMTGKPTPQRRGSYAMQTGLYREAFAVRAWENDTGILTRAVGFVLHNEMPIGCSPDAVVGDFEGLLQVKCPEAATHYQTIVDQRGPALTPEQQDVYVHDEVGAIPPEYLSQIRHELYVTGAAWCDYVSYHPDFPPTLRLVVIRVQADEAKLTAYAEDVKRFIDEVDEQSAQLARWAA